jgi:hypothetical protein
LTNKTTPYYLSGQPKFKKRIDKRISAAGAVLHKNIMLRYYYYEEFDQYRDAFKRKNN